MQIICGQRFSCLLCLAVAMLERLQSKTVELETPVPGYLDNSHNSQIKHTNIHLYSPPSRYHHELYVRVCVFVCISPCNTRRSAEKST